MLACHRGCRPPQGLHAWNAHLGLRPRALGGVRPLALLSRVSCMKEEKARTDSGTSTTVHVSRFRLKAGKLGKRAPVSRAGARTGFCAQASMLSRQAVLVLVPLREATPERPWATSGYCPPGAARGPHRSPTGRPQIPHSAATGSLVQKPCRSMSCCAREGPCCRHHPIFHGETLLLRPAACRTQGTNKERH